MARLQSLLALLLLFASAILVEGKCTGAYCDIGRNCRKEADGSVYCCLPGRCSRDKSSLSDKDALVDESGSTQGSNGTASSSVSTAATSTSSTNYCDSTSTSTKNLSGWSCTTLPPPAQGQGGGCPVTVCESTETAMPTSSSKSPSSQPTVTSTTIGAGSAPTASSEGARSRNIVWTSLSLPVLGLVAVIV